MALSDMYRWPMFPANSGFLVNAQTGEHVKSVPVPQYLPEPTLEMIVNAVTGAPKSITRRILVPDVEHYLAERTVCQVSPSKRASTKFFETSRMQCRECRRTCPRRCPTS